MCSFQLRQLHSEATAGVNPCLLPDSVNKYKFYHSLQVAGKRCQSLLLPGENNSHRSLGRLQIIGEMQIDLSSNQTHCFVL
jgi:hypothetical protein